jgi:hypothetical protein
VSERYTPAPVMMSSAKTTSSALTSAAKRPPMRLPSVSSCSSVKTHPDDESHYASVDEIIMVPPRLSQIDDVRGSIASAKSKRSSHKSGNFANSGVYADVRRQRRTSDDVVARDSLPPRYSEVIRDDVTVTSQTNVITGTGERVASEYERLGPGRRPSHVYTPLKVGGVAAAGAVVATTGGGNKPESNYLTPVASLRRSRPHAANATNTSMAMWRDGSAVTPSDPYRGDRSAKPQPLASATSSRNPKRPSEEERMSGSSYNTAMPQTMAPRLPPQQPASLPQTRDGSSRAPQRQRGGEGRPPLPSRSEQLAARPSEFRDVRSSSSRGPSVDRDGYMIPMPQRRQ